MAKVFKKALSLGTWGNGRITLGGGKSFSGMSRGQSAGKKKEAKDTRTRKK